MIESKEKKEEKKDYLEEAKRKIDIIEKSGLPAEVKNVGELGAVMGVPTESIIHGMVAAGDALASREASAKAPKQRKFANYTPVERKVAELLTEDTGVAMMDSGGAYGRAWQRNREIKDFKSLPATIVETDVDEKDPKNSSLSISLDTFHFLVDRLDITPESEKVEKEFERFRKLPENEDLGGYPAAEEFAEKYGEDYSSVNTYNGEDAVNQTLQYTYFRKRVDDGNYHDFVLLQIHGGCDVRGGYTEPYVFELDDETGLMDNADLYASTGEGENRKNWSSDDAGYDWYYEGSTAEPKDKRDQGQHGGVPENWEITKDGVYYAPTGEPIDFGNDGIVNGKKAPPKLSREKTGTYKDLRYTEYSEDQKRLKA